MAFCPKCGKPFEDNASNCAFCGAKNPAVPTTVNPKISDMVNKAKNLNKKNITIIACAALALVLVIVIISSILGNSYKKAIDNFFDFTVKCEIDKLEKLAPEDFWDKLEKDKDIDLDEIKEELEERFDGELEELEDYYGKNLKVKYKVLEKEVMDEDDLDDLKDNLKDTYGIKKRSVQKALEVEVEATIKGRDDEDTMEQDMIIVKIDGDWYITTVFSMLRWSF